MTFDLAWLEEPVIADDFEGYHKIADAIATPVVGGENHFTHHDLKPFFEERQRSRSCSLTSCAAAIPNSASSPSTRRVRA